MKNNVQLKNLKFSAKDGFIYRTGDTGNIIEVTVDYNNGSASRRHRGIWVHVQPWTISEETRSTDLMSGIAIMVERLERAKPTALAAAAERLDHDAIALAALFIVDKNEAKAAIRELYGIPAPASAAPPQYVPAGGGQ